MTNISELLSLKKLKKNSSFYDLHPFFRFHGLSAAGIAPAGVCFGNDHAFLFEKEYHP